jgi:hypothetical protein
MPFLAALLGGWLGERRQRSHGVMTTRACARRRRRCSVGTAHGTGRMLHLPHLMGDTLLPPD